MSNLKLGRIGIDLDNTLIDYSEAARRLAREESIQEVSSVGDLRKLLRESDNEKWQFFQARIYTEGLAYATPSQGCIDFILSARKFGYQLFVVSHKTMRTPEKFGGRDLRGPAREWLKLAGITPGLIPEDRVFFCNSQREKVEKVADLSLNWFIDDLAEVLDHPDFPEHTLRWLYSPDSIDDSRSDLQDSLELGTLRKVSGFSAIAQFLKGEPLGA